MLTMLIHAQPRPFRGVRCIGQFPASLWQDEQNGDRPTRELCRPA